MSIVCFIILLAFLFALLGDLSLVTEADLAANWAPEPDNVPYMGDPTQLIEPKNLKPAKALRRGIFVAPPLPLLVEEVAIPVAAPLEVSPISLRKRLFGRPEPVCFV